MARPPMAPPRRSPAEAARDAILDDEPGPATPAAPVVVPVVADPVPVPGPAPAPAPAARAAEPRPSARARRADDGHAALVPPVFGEGDETQLVVTSVRITRAAKRKLDWLAQHGYVQGANKATREAIELFVNTLYERATSGEVTPVSRASTVLSAR